MIICGTLLRKQQQEWLPAYRVEAAQTAAFILTLFADQEIIVDYVTQMLV